MLKYIFSLLFALSSANTFAQVAIANNKLNVLHLCLDNPISVAVAGVPSENIKVEATGADIVLTPDPNSASHYIAKVSKKEPVQITLSDKKTGKIYATIPFRVVALPLPTVRLTKSIDHRVISFTASIENFDIDARCEVVSYTMTFSRKGQETQVISCVGNRLTGHAHDCYRACSLNDVITFYDIMVRCPCDATPRRVPPINLPIR